VSVDRRAFLNGMRGVAHSVAIVTTDGTAGRHGATVTSFCSVSADPPTLLVCLHAGSRIAETVKANRTFCVNVLRESAVRLAERFAGRTAGQSSDRFDGVMIHSDAGVAPILADAAVAFHCVLAEALTSGSHVIAVGSVESVHTADEAPLTYVDGAYASVRRHSAPSAN
jgi:flavin reductase (DIM6/NTAB) family NADH-FMN oxidoreductase RutF